MHVGTRVFLNHCPPYFGGQGFSLSLQFAHLSRLAGQQAPGIPCFISQWGWQRHATAVPVIHVELLSLVWQALYLLNQISRPVFSLFLKCLRVPRIEFGEGCGSTGSGSDIRELGHIALPSCTGRQFLHLYKGNCAQTIMRGNLKSLWSDELYPSSWDKFRHISLASQQMVSLGPENLWWFSLNCWLLTPHGSLSTVWGLTF